MWLITIPMDVREPFFKLNFPRQVQNFFIETLSKRQSVFLEKHESERRGELVINTTLAFFDYDSFNAGVKLLVFKSNKPQILIHFALTPW